ncbi:MAG: hypothetical protein ABW032_12495 [Burkholderiaceae bacterium]
MPRVTHVIVPRYPLTDFLFERMHGFDDVKIIEHPLSRRRGSGLLRGIEVYLLFWLRRSFHFDRAYVDQLARIRPDDSVIFFALENRKDLQIARKFIAAFRQVVWLWNPIRNYRGNALSRLWYRHWIGRSGMQAYTFDPADARDHGLRLAPQVYRRVTPDDLPAPHGEAPRRDVYFLGIDKGRLPALQALKADFDRIGLSSHFHVVADKRRRYREGDRAWLASRWLPYDENLRQVFESRALLELLQSTQSGPTIRSMEALFLNRKLITNNRSLRETPLYHPSRIFILGQDDMAGLRHFIDGPIEPPAAAVLRAHDIQFWIRRFEA